MLSLDFVRKGLIKACRYGTAPLLVFLGFFSSFFMFNYYDAAHRININEARDLEEYSYQSTFSCLAFGEQFDFRDIEYERDFSECDVMISDTWVYVGDAEYPRGADVVLYGDELIYPIIGGHYPTYQDFESDGCCVVLGKRLKRDAYIRDGQDYILINGDECRVTGYVSAGSSALLDYKVILYYDCLGDGIMEDIEYYKNRAGLFVMFCSREDVSNYKASLDRYIEIYPENLYNIDYNPFAVTHAVSAGNRRIAGVIYVFSVIVVVMVVIYWYLDNKKELVIRRVYGYSRLRLILLIAKRLMGLLVVAVLVSELLIICMNHMEGIFEVVSAGNLAEHIRMIIKYIVITILLLLVFPIFRICVDRPDVLMRDSD